MNELPLRDIHLPAEISWWPLAIGWWLLPVLITLSIFLIIKFIKYKRLNRKVAFRKIALNELNQLRSKFKDENNSIELIRSVSSLLRRIALSYLPRENAASLTGKNWVSLLNDLSTQTVFTDKTGSLLEQGPYMKQCEFNHSELLSICETWIKTLPETNNTDSITGVTS
ncbi:MAG: DUF4381 domain-containing protein [endosymbiont of Galathealinum brachiosum]|uniref:DUF4381 domain-containing protein n=1 Tax=endosymbiont of Galathealinum brachiosum TaxID=2200906 RepID=A0A370DB42_9GAMM|nr:MAG: DUF4381 domain-containing protein [endosymbiont of Galathealinum brachiosum]